MAVALGYTNYRDALNKHVDGEDKEVANCDNLAEHKTITLIQGSGSNYKNNTTLINESDFSCKSLIIRLFQHTSP
ncbi:BRO-N domain-containing protein [Prevotella lacticifex]|uniref:BRO-N domain-containing protein n=1 Tax=Prevotella lacticifex TaxID=2854755 RepID=UPI001CC413F4|nr:Bro-N domain-containing protein [Prevotella lacticifex]MDY6265496.1 Bro-N domain-containing protein [Prevotella sp.]